jgi:hypothetical protein
MDKEEGEKYALHILTIVLYVIEEFQMFILRLSMGPSLESV